MANDRVDFADRADAACAVPMMCGSSGWPCHAASPGVSRCACGCQRRRRARALQRRVADKHPGRAQAPRRTAESGCRSAGTGCSHRTRPPDSDAPQWLQRFVLPARRSPHRATSRYLGSLPRAPSTARSIVRSIRASGGVSAECCAAAGAERPTVFVATAAERWRGCGCRVCTATPRAARSTCSRDREGHGHFSRLRT
jgi:hypothetical protein